MAIKRVFVANRGEIAVRVIRACQSLGLETVLAVSEADRVSLGARMADRTVCIGPPLSAASYLSIPAVVTAAVATGSDALHPGYGFLAESEALAEACEEAGVTFIGPKREHLRAMGNKLEARETVREFGIPTVPGSKKVATHEDATRAAQEMGFPVLFKAAAGGGGRGIKIVPEPAVLRETFQTASAEARASFGDSTLYLEQYIPNARHVEVQVLGDRMGNTLHLGERDCSLQRRYQKVVEEAPATAVPPPVREALRAAGATIAARLGYESAGTVEFIYDQDTERFYFLEMNTRIQVEHPVTEMITGLDLVQAQIRVADNHPLPFTQDEVRFDGHAIECRITAEAPEHGFRPSPGVLSVWDPPTGPGVRVDSHGYAGYRVPPFYDSLLAKLIVHGRDRAETRERLLRALDHFEVRGVDTTIPFLHSVVSDPDFERGTVNTKWIEDVKLQRGPGRRTEC